ncbi:hypothetical protein RP20_CCG002625 [Aedes albopictus]|nr:hypothetical protein RP20_CCG002625 [Aedes albopictus]
MYSKKHIAVVVVVVHLQGGGNPARHRMVRNTRGCGKVAPRVAIFEFEKTNTSQVVLFTYFCDDFGTQRISNGTTPKTHGNKVHDEGEVH